MSHLDDFVAEGIKAVVTLNQEFEVFVSPQKYKVSSPSFPPRSLTLSPSRAPLDSLASFFQELGIAHLHIPTTDYLFAPTHEEITRGTQFIRGAFLYSFSTQPPSATPGNSLVRFGTSQQTTSCEGRKPTCTVRPDAGGARHWCFAT